MSDAVRRRRGVDPLRCPYINNSCVAETNRNRSRSRSRSRNLWVSPLLRPGVNLHRREKEKKRTPPTGRKLISESEPGIKVSQTVHLPKLLLTSHACSSSSAPSCPQRCVCCCSMIALIVLIEAGKFFFFFHCTNET